MNRTTPLIEAAGGAVRRIVPILYTRLPSLDCHAIAAESPCIQSVNLHGQGTPKSRRSSDRRSLPFNRPKMLTGVARIVRGFKSQYLSPAIKLNIEVVLKTLDLQSTSSPIFTGLLSCMWGVSHLCI